MFVCVPSLSIIWMWNWINFERITYLPRFPGQLCDIFTVTGDLAILQNAIVFHIYITIHFISYFFPPNIYLICASLHPIGIVLNQFEATLSDMLFVQFAVQMWNPRVQESIQFVGTIFGYTEPKFWSQFIFAVRHNIRWQWHCFTDRFSHTQSQIQWWISTCSCRSWYQFYLIFFYRTQRESEQFQLEKFFNIYNQNWAFDNHI